MQPNRLFYDGQNPRYTSNYGQINAPIQSQQYITVPNPHYMGHHTFNHQPRYNQMPLGYPVARPQPNFQPKPFIPNQPPLPYYYNTIHQSQTDHRYQNIPMNMLQPSKYYKDIQRPKSSKLITRQSSHHTEEESLPPWNGSRPSTPVIIKNSLSTIERYRLNRSESTKSIEYEPYTYSEYRDLKSRDSQVSFIKH
ncbi:hypothetical protein BC833DRAFT_581246 [Globomyces pollinis-pini]|nr:hypothetical protein BC833DRAFT_581246 [Globomyces pollinis-pini]